MPSITTIKRFACGHTNTWETPGYREARTEHVASQFRCDECMRAPDAPVWVRGGYPSEAAYQAAVQHDRDITAREAARATRLAALAALPEAERPFRTTVMEGFGTLEELAREDEPVRRRPLSPDEAYAAYTAEDDARIDDLVAAEDALLPPDDDDRV